MYDDQGRPPSGSGKLVILFIIALLLVIGVTFALNSTVSRPAVEEPAEVQNYSNNTTATVAPTVIGEDNYGKVSKYSGYGNSTSEIRIALIVGVNQKSNTSNSIIPTIENDKSLNYSYDIYLIETTGDNFTDNTTNIQNNLSSNEKSEELASNYVVPDVVNNNYNFTIDVHSTNDSNSYVFVPVEDTYTSKLVVQNISNNSGVGQYTPSSHNYTNAVSIPIINSNIPSIVYVTREYNLNTPSQEVASVLSTIDDFDFLHLFDIKTTDNSTNSSKTNKTYSTNKTNNSYSSSNSSRGNTEIKD